MTKKDKLVCIEGIADHDNVNVICVKGDVVRVLEVEEGQILVEVESGWAEGAELNFTPKVFARHFSWVI